MDRVVYTKGENVARTSEPISLSLAAMGFLVGGGAAAGALAVNENKKYFDDLWAQDHVKNIQDGFDEVGKFTRDPAKHIQKWWREKSKRRSVPPAGGDKQSGRGGRHGSHVGPPLSTTEEHAVAKYYGMH